MLPSSNKALAAVLKDATPEQLAILSQPKDIKSVLSDLLNDTLGSSRSNSVILDMLKSSPLFKNLGNFTSDLKQLLYLLRRDHSSAAIQGALKSFIATVEKMDEKTLQKQIADSGVFLESKIAGKADPLSSLKTLLEQTALLLKGSATPEAKASERLITTLLDNKHLSLPPSATASPRQLQSMTETLKGLVTLLQDARPSPVANVHKEITVVIEKLQLLAQETPLKSGNTLPKDIRELLVQLSDKAAPSVVSESKAAVVDAKALSVASSVLSADVKVILSENKSVSGLIERLLFKLDALILSEAKVAPLAAMFTEKNIPQDIRALIGQLQEIMPVKDAILSPEVAKLADKLALFTRPGELIPGATIKEQVSTDVKALLLQMGDDVRKADLPGNVEISRLIDKLMVQIDYYQLLSHLSSSNYLYIPFEWDLLEQGGMSFKKGDVEGFYCEINLRLRDYGELKLMLNLQEKKRLDITILTEKDRLKEKFKTHNQALRAAITAADLIPGQIRLFDIEHAETPQPYTQQGHRRDIDLGFEVKV